MAEKVVELVEVSGHTEVCVDGPNGTGEPDQPPEKGQF